MAQRLKILELCEYSAGICGVFTRVLAESQLLAENHDVFIFSSNIEKGTKNIAPIEQTLGKVHIKRFPVKRKIAEGSGGALFWDFEQAALDLNPDIIITHNYRHPHNNKALKIAGKIRAKCFLVTHAPFVEPHLRSWKGKLGVYVYDTFLSKLNAFDKVIAITHWELPYLKKLKVNPEKIVYIPNGIPDIFFKEKIKPFKWREIIYFGRISPIKDLETLLKAYQQVKEKNKAVYLKIIGPEEFEYGLQLKKLSEKLGLDTQFIPPVFDLQEKIKILQKADIFILPSKREAMPQALIELMALGKIVITSNTEGGKDVVENGKNGLIFQIKNAHELGEKILYTLDKRNSGKIRKMQQSARKTAEQFAWSKVIKKLEALLSSVSENVPKRAQNRKIYTQNS